MRSSGRMYVVSSAPSLYRQCERDQPSGPAALISLEEKWATRYWPPTEAASAILYPSLYRPLSAEFYLETDDTVMDY